MNKFFKSAMFFTSFMPLWITILFIDTLNILREEQYLYTEYISIILILLGMIVSVIIIFNSIKVLADNTFKKYKIISVNQEKGITSEFLLSYILPLFAFDFTKWESVVEFLIYFSILSFLCIRNNNVYANLFFELRKYKFYSCEMIWMAEPDTSPLQMIVISKKPLCSYKDNIIKVASLNKPFYLEK